MSIEIGTIFGVSLGAEYYPDDGDDFIQSMLTVDLFIIRIAFVWFR